MGPAVGVAAGVGVRLGTGDGDSVGVGEGTGASVAVGAIAVSVGTGVKTVGAGGGVEFWLELEHPATIRATTANKTMLRGIKRVQRKKGIACPLWGTGIYLVYVYLSPTDLGQARDASLANAMDLEGIRCESGPGHSLELLRESEGHVLVKHLYLTGIGNSTSAQKLQHLGDLDFRGRCSRADADGADAFQPFF